MKSSIVQLYVEGIRLEREAVFSASPIIGDLVISIESRSAKQVILADLVDRSFGCKRPLLAPLFNPMIVKMAEGNNGFVLRGSQFTSHDGDVRELAQEWWVRPEI